MKFSEIMTRLSGISTPIFGVSWQPPRSDVAAAREAITFLEDRAALFAPYVAETPEHAVSSILSIRREMTRIMAPGGLSDQLMSSLRTIRAACRTFTTTIGAEPRGGQLIVPVTAFGTTHVNDVNFNQALGALRGVVGSEVAKIAAAHGLDVENGLASILPAADDHDDNEPQSVVIEHPQEIYIEPSED